MSLKFFLIFCILSVDAGQQIWFDFLKPEEGSIMRQPEWTFQPKQNSKSLAVRGATRAEVTGLLFRSNSPAFRIGGGGGRVTVVTFDTRKDCRRCFRQLCMLGGPTPWNIVYMKSGDWVLHVDWSIDKSPGKNWPITSTSSSRWSPLFVYPISDGSGPHCSMHTMYRVTHQVRP